MGSYSLRCRVRQAGVVRVAEAVEAPAGYVAGFIRGVADGMEALPDAIVLDLTMTYNEDVPAQQLAGVPSFHVEADAEADAEADVA